MGKSIIFENVNVGLLYLNCILNGVSSLAPNELNHLTSLLGSPSKPNILSACCSSADEPLPECIFNLFNFPFSSLPCDLGI